MAIKDIRSQNLQQDAFNQFISANGNFDGAILDTADNDGGFMISVMTANYVDGSYSVSIFESDDSGMAGATEITDPQKIIGTSPIVVSAATASGDILETMGVFSNKRYLRVRVVASAVTTGSDVIVVSTQAPEVVPVK